MGAKEALLQPNAFFRVLNVPVVVAAGAGPVLNLMGGKPTRPEQGGRAVPKVAVAVAAGRWQGFTKVIPNHLTLQKEIPVVTRIRVVLVAAGAVERLLMEVVLTIQTLNIMALRVVAAAEEAMPEVREIPETLVQRQIQQPIIA